MTNSETDRMDMEYIKEVYNDDPHYKLHYTKELHPSNSTPPHLHYDTSLVLTYFLKGSGSILIEGQLYYVNPGDLLLLNQSEIHVLNIDDRSHERISLYIYDSIFDRWKCSEHHFFDTFLKRANGTNNVIPADTVSALHIGTQLQKILDYNRRKTTEGSVLASCAIIELLDMLNRTSVTSEGAAPIKSISNKHINAVIKYLSENYTQKININDLAEMFHFNKYYLCRLFKECTGTSIVEYCTFKKILVFNQLICQNMALEDAAYKAGFQNYSNFFRLYKKHTGMSPSEYKQKIQNEPQTT